MIAVRIWEGLGNQMFQYAYARALKEKLNLPVFLEKDRVYREYFDNEDTQTERQYALDKFEITLDTVDLRTDRQWCFLKQNTVVYKKIFNLSCKGKWRYNFYTDANGPYKYNTELWNIKKNAYIMGQFFNKQYYEDIKDILNKEFSIKALPVIESWLEDVLDSCNTVSVHIRRGDYIKLQQSLEFDRYYASAIRYCRKKLHNPVFLFFTDDIQWIKDNIHLNNSYIVSNGILKDYEELYLMTRCKNNIIANSTFSYWGAWLNRNEQKIVVTPNGWMPGIIPSDWIRL